MRVCEQDCGKRADVFLVSFLSDRSRAFISEMIRKGDICVNGQRKKPAYILKTGDNIEGCIPDPEPADIEAQPIALDILYEDEHLLVIDKAAGIVVHPAPGHAQGTIVNAVLYHCPNMGEIGGKIRPGIVHRLDKDTSGLLVIAKNDAAHQHLAMQFKARTIQKQYLALVHGCPERNAGTISLSIGRHPTDRKKMSVISRKSRIAETVWTVTERFSEASLLMVGLKTGRTHQIRVHCAAIGHPIIGDTVYGGRKKSHSPDISVLLQAVSRQMLHAWHLEFEHPRTHQPLCFEAPIPQDMKTLIENLRTPSSEPRLVYAHIS